MGIKKALTGLGLAFALAVSSTASAVTLQDFDSAPDKARSVFVADVLGQIFDQYNAKDETRPKAQCMADLYNTKVVFGGSEISQISKLINLELDLARSKTGDTFNVEDIIYGVVDRECASATTVAGSPQPPNGPG